VLANWDSPHAWRWTKVFVARGHEVHAISYYPPARELPGAYLHVLRPRAASMAPAPPPASGNGGMKKVVPPSALRVLNAMRFARAGLGGVVREIAPDVLQAHFVVEHGLFGALTAYHPYVVNAWGSDIFQAPRTLAGRWTARFVLGHTDLLNANDAAMARAAVALGMPAERVSAIGLGLEREWLDAPLAGVNAGPGTAPPLIVSDRALEPLYNIDVVLRAVAGLRVRLPGARLVVAGDGSQAAGLRKLASDLRLGESVEFVGFVEGARLQKLLSQAQVYVSVPSSDSFPVSTLEAMATGAFPIVSDLASQDGWITHRLNGLRVPSRDAEALAEAMRTALEDDDLRRRAAEANRRAVEARGDLERNMVEFERELYGLAGRPVD
jgi:glycosyltransferase involved in cell wall biosynthesis